MATYHAKNTFRDYNTDGVASSGKFKPRKSDIREWGRTWDWIASPVGSTLDTNEFVVTIASATREGLPSYYNGLIMAFQAPSSLPSDTAASITINVDGLGSKNIKVPNGINMDAATADCFTELQLYLVKYSSAEGAFVLINPDMPRRQLLRSASTGLVIDRQSMDGSLQIFRRDNVDVGTISVASGTVSYGSFSGMHWSQPVEGSSKFLLMGTVMETVDEMCTWPGEENLTLPKVRVSRKYGSTNVYGVFRQIDEDGDLEIAALGVNLVRITPGMTVEIGDLLVSNGNGCAAPQVDDLVRSSTLGKVLSSEPQITYTDQSYLVPCVLYCG